MATKQPSLLRLETCLSTPIYFQLSEQSVQSELHTYLGMGPLPPRLRIALCAQLSRKIRIGCCFELSSFNEDDVG